MKKKISLNPDAVVLGIVVFGLWFMLYIVPFLGWLK